MASTPNDRTAEWEGGSLGELVAAMQASALPVRIEVIVPGTMGSNAGEVHLIAGGMADAFAGSLRRDDAMAALQRLEGARFQVETRLPNPESGTLTEPGPEKGSLKDRPLAALMRYCEDYVLTCRVEIARGQERGVISYKRGELVGSTVNGKDGDELLPTMLGWSDGTYEIVLPPPPLPAAPARKRETQPIPRPGEPAKGERKRHSTLPIVPGAPAHPTGPTPPPVPAIGLATTTPDLTRPFEPARAAALVAQAPVVAQKPPSRPSIPAPSSLHLSSPAQPPATARPAAAPGVVPQTSFPPENTKRGIPIVPGAQSAAAGKVGAAAPKPVVQPPSAKPASPPVAGAAARTPPKPPAAVPAAASPAPKPAPQASLKSAAPPATTASKPAPAPAPSPAKPPAAPPAVASKPATLPAHPAPAASTAKPATLPAHPAPAASSAKPAAPVASAGTLPAHPAPVAAKPIAHQPATPPPIKPVQPATPPPAKAATLPSHPAPVAPKPAAQPPVPPAKAATLPSHAAVSPPATPAEAPATVPKPAPPSNDLKPASGTIQSKPARANPARPAVAPIEVAEEPAVKTKTPTPQVVQTALPPRRRTTARKKAPEHPVRVYLLTGLAIGLGIVLAYWLYYSRPFGL